MSENNLKIATLNLWRFTDWDSRLPLIINTIRRLDPDVLLLQEVQRDPSYGHEDQATIISNELGYPYVHFEVSCIKTTRKGVPLPHPVEHGLGIISKIPFQTESIRLTQDIEDKEPRFLLKADLKILNNPITITNVHFSNKDEWVESQLRETLKIYSDKNIKSILAGDFNIKDISQYKDLYQIDYTASADNFSYISYPEDNVSYDHIFIPKNYSFADFLCDDKVISDHRMLYAEVKYN